jgi:hypothetical protein
MICVVDSVQESLVIVKIILKEVNDLDERNYNLYNLLTKNSEWTLVKLCSLENFNRSFVGFDSFQLCSLWKEMLDLTVKPVLTTSTQFSLDAMDCLAPGQADLVKYALRKRGVTAYSGGFRTGKS